MLPWFFFFLVHFVLGFFFSSDNLSKSLAFLVGLDNCLTWEGHQLVYTLTWDLPSKNAGPQTHFVFYSLCLASAICICNFNNLLLTKKIILGKYNPRLTKTHDILHHIIILLTKTKTQCTSIVWKAKHAFTAITGNGALRCMLTKGHGGKTSAISSEKQMLLLIGVIRPFPNNLKFIILKQMHSQLPIFPWVDISANSPKVRQCNTQWKWKNPRSTSQTPWASVSM